MRRNNVRSSSPRSAWEKEDFNPNVRARSSSRPRSAWEKENFNPKVPVDATERIMEINNDDIASFRGWFLKEKHDKFKKSQALLPVASSNRRWFTIERGDGDQAKDLLICYYKQSSAEKEDRCGWLFLNDIVALSQDIPDQWITIEHPTRIMRIQSPTPAQHRLWFHALSKYCKNARKDAKSPSSSQPSEGLSYFSENLARIARINSTKEMKDPLTSTPKDELQFLREITGQATEEAEAVGKNLFPNVSSFTSKDDSKPMTTKDGSGRSSSEEEATESNSSSPSSYLEERLSSAIVNNVFPPESEEMAEAELLHPNVADTSFCGGASTPRLGDENDQFVMKDLRRAWSESDNLLRCEEKGGTISSSSSRANDPFDTNNMRRALSKREDPSLSLMHIHSSHSLSSSKLVPRSSSYRMLFGNDDEDEIIPDDHFLDDWDT